MSKIIIGADFVPTKSNQQLFISADTERLFGRELLSVLNRAGYRIFNLEVPLTENNSPINKNGPALIAPTAAANMFSEINVNLFTLSNNHIMDQDEQGLKSTLETLKKQNIRYVGVGNDVFSAAIPYIFELDNKKIGVYACAEHEFSIAEKNKCGANPFDPLESLDHISDLKKKVDYVMVLYHGGKEHYRYPSPLLQKACRKMVDKGADLIVCQHTHCVGAKEEYKGSTIVYGQGNFVFDITDNEFWNNALLIELDTKNFSIDYIPIIKKGNAVRLAEDNDYQDILNGFLSRSEQILGDGFIEKNYVEFSRKAQHSYCFSLLGRVNRTIFFRGLRKIFKNNFEKIFWKRKDYTRIINILECEAHRELFLTRLKDKVKDK